MMPAQNPGEVAAARAAQARGAAEEARAEAAQARAEAEQARAEAREDARDARDAAQEPAGRPNIVIMQDGKPVDLGAISPQTWEQLGAPPQLPNSGNDGAYAVGVTGIIMSSIVAIVGIRTWFRAKVIRNAAPAALSSDMEARMMRIEAAVESVAVEVERISEGQRFTTRVLTERAKSEVLRG
jgi:hypothetical protein